MGGGYGYLGGIFSIRKFDREKNVCQKYSKSTLCLKKLVLVNKIMLGRKPKKDSLTPKKNIIPAFKLNGCSLKRNDCKTSLAFNKTTKYRHVPLINHRECNA